MEKAREKGAGGVSYPQDIEMWNRAKELLGAELLREREDMLATRQIWHDFRMVAQKSGLVYLKKYCAAHKIDNYSDYGFLTTCDELWGGLDRGEWNRALAQLVPLYLSREEEETLQNFYDKMQVHGACDETVFAQLCDAEQFMSFHVGSLLGDCESLRLARKYLHNLSYRHKYGTERALLEKCGRVYDYFNAQRKENGTLIDGWLRSEACLL